MKSQAGVEFIILVSVLLSISVIILANAFKEMELNMAVASARSASETIALQQGVVFYNVSYSVKPNIVILAPSFSSDFQDRDSSLRKIAARMQRVIAPNSQIEICPNQLLEGCCANPELTAGVACFSTTRCFCLK